MRRASDAAAAGSTSSPSATSPDPLASCPACALGPCLAPSSKGCSRPAPSKRLPTPPAPADPCCASTRASVPVRGCATRARRTLRAAGTAASWRLASAARTPSLAGVRGQGGPQVVGALAAVAALAVLPVTAERRPGPCSNAPSSVRWKGAAPPASPSVCEAGTRAWGAAVCACRGALRRGELEGGPRCCWPCSKRATCTERAGKRRVSGAGRCSTSDAPNCNPVGAPPVAGEGHKLEGLWGAHASVPGQPCCGVLGASVRCMLRLRCQGQSRTKPPMLDAHRQRHAHAHVHTCIHVHAHVRTCAHAPTHTRACCTKSGLRGSSLAWPSQGTALEGWARLGIRPPAPEPPCLSPGEAGKSAAQWSRLVCSSSEGACWSAAGLCVPCAAMTRGARAWWWRPRLKAAMGERSMPVAGRGGRGPGAAGGRAGGGGCGTFSLRGALACTDGAAHTCGPSNT